MNHITNHPVYEETRSFKCNQEEEKNGHISID